MWFHDSPHSSNRRLNRDSNCTSYVRNNVTGTAILCVRGKKHRFTSKHEGQQNSFEMSFRGIHKILVIGQCSNKKQTLRTKMSYFNASSWHILNKNMDIKI